MTRPFGLGDLGLLWSLRGQGITFDMQRAALWKSRPVQSALRGILPARPLGTVLTYVCQAEQAGRGGFVQLLTCPERLEWQVIHLAPWTEAGGHGAGMDWAGALAGLCLQASRWGALRIRAGVAEGGLEEETFRQAGFAVYTREEIYRLACLEDTDRLLGPLRPVTVTDAWPLTQLVGQTVPPAVQHAEGMTVSISPDSILTRLGVTCEQGYVLERGAELAAYAGLSRSRRGAWARILLHPDARGSAGDVVRHVAAAASAAPVLYCAVREYQAGLRSVLEDMGFEFVGVQVWLVKHTARLVEYRRYRHAAALEKRIEPAATPLHPVNNVPAVTCFGMAREHCAYECRRTDSHTIGSN